MHRILTAIFLVVIVTFAPLCFFASPQAQNHHAIAEDAYTLSPCAESPIHCMLLASMILDAHMSMYDLIANAYVKVFSFPYVRTLTSIMSVVFVRAVRERALLRTLRMVNTLRTLCVSVRLRGSLRHFLVLLTASPNARDNCAPGC